VLRNNLTILNWFWYPGDFALEIPPARRGVPQIEVTFHINANGILQVTALDLGTGNKAQKKINNYHNRLSQDDIERMVKNARKYSAQDKNNVERITTRNNLESYLYNVRNLLLDENEFGGLLYEDEKVELEETIRKIFEYLEANPKASTLELKGQLMIIESLVDRLVGRILATTGRLIQVNETKAHDHDELWIYGLDNSSVLLRTFETCVTPMADLFILGIVF